MLETAENRAGKLQGLQVLRGVAALLVVYHHLKYSLGVPSTEVSGTRVLATNLGAIGVDIFFVISGFVIAMTASRLDKDWRAFLASRIARVVPLYFTLSTFMLLRELIVHLVFSGQALPSVNSIFNSYCFIPLLDTQTYSSPLCANGWTLSFEMWFYLGFGLCIAWAGGVLAGRIFPALMLTGVVLTALLTTSQSWFLPRFLFHPLFVLMCILAPIFLFFAGQHEQLGLHMEVLNSTRLGLERAAIWGGFAVCLVGIMTYLDLYISLTWPRIPLLLGDASYSIYLITPLVMTPTAALVHGLKYFHLLASTMGTEIISGFFYLTGTVLGGVILWKYYEAPVSKAAKKFLLRFPKGARTIF